MVTTKMTAAFRNPSGKQVATDKVAEKLSSTLSWVKNTVSHTVSQMASQVASPSASLHTTSSSTTLSTPALSPSSPSQLSPDDLELLAKLEEQNRLLETDSKSLRSVNGSRRNSGSSLVSSSSASSNLSHLEEDSWILWGRIVNEWEDVRKKKEKQVKELVRKGIPHHFRAIVWQLLCSAQSMPIKDQYSELLKMTSPCEKLIRRDIARTYPEHNFFKEKDSLGQEVLFNVMKAYSLVDREVGYCQGSAFIVGLLLMQMPEEEAFCVFVKLMQDYRLRELFKPSMAELGLCMYQFECMIQEHLPELFVHFQSQSFHTSMYASSWFLTIFLTTFPLPIATRIFDIFMSEGLEIVFRVGLALLQMNQAELMQLDMEGMLQHFQKVIPHQFDGVPDKLIQAAYQVKYNSKKMKKLEKEYTTIKTKEMEEQVEIKRLRTENRLLKQRIETLEKESASLADRLIQHKCSSNYNEDFVLQLEKELVQARLSEAESQCALKEMQDKVLDIEKRNNSLPDENNIARLQEELIAVKLREAEAIMGLKELRQQVKDLEEHWQRHLARTTGRWKDPPKKNAMNELQDELMTIRLREAETQAEIREIKQKMMEMETQNQINSNHLRRAEQEVVSLQEKVQYLSAQNKGLLTQLSEAKRKQAEIECKNKEEVMAVRLREADSIAAVAELRQHIAELEIQKEEGKLQGQLNKSDSNQYIRELKDQIAELNHELRCLKGQRGFSGQPPFDGIHIVNHLIGDDESFHSSDEDFIDNSLQETGVGFPLHGKSGSMSLDPAVADGSESETEDSVLETRESNQVVQKERPPRRRESYSTTV
ncbi:ecotropic viral integration site 5 protein homolog isoform X3 [Macaca nemestrina]|uniref:Ecotropic viral integration site 5 n=5 Tax=Cercopithecinae TaxID=9528 RepID=F7GWG2_MACMU|nr:ecotropic viral integration site 5 protein homolog isoform X3 [Macaca mulatta]XP_011746010.1 ecotropic viral integration site 5 protein homolog isoform X3 [Macaca nemestrina]XP_011923356.1 PREDICTED: ecotropic viral integration site 5 protein homolog isoform X4 [Cercocebus atys]XP_015288213.1 ecotropic viral integration site 5 protein homolog isoform X5 [Macaca fascicularis]XP_025212871.1 ecotropic viral integration site 5 protein homolog isoform X2 [Theropithecus gelada]